MAAEKGSVRIEILETGSDFSVGANHRSVGSNVRALAFFNFRKHRRQRQFNPTVICFSKYLLNFDQQIL